MISPQDLEQAFKNNASKFIRLRLKYITAKAIQELTEELDKDIKKNVLCSNNFKFSSEWKEEKKEYGDYIRKPELDYLMSESDFIKYCKLCHTERLSRGLKITDNYNLSLDYQTFKDFKAAEQEFLSFTISILPEPFKTELKPLLDGGYYDIRKKFINLSLKIGVKQ